MKKISIVLVFAFLSLSFILASCTGGVSVNAWPNAAMGEYGVYLASGTHIYHEATALEGDLKPEEKYWSYPQKADSLMLFYSAPAISENLIVAGSWTSGKDGKYGLYGIDLKGQPAWAASDGRTAAPFMEAKGRWIASPAICGDLIFAPNMDQNIYVLNLSGGLESTYGKESYASDIRKEADEVNIGSYWAQPVCNETQVFISNLNHYLFAFDQAENIQLAWQTDLKAGLVSSPAFLSDGSLVIGNINGGLFVIDPEFGIILHTVQLEGGIWAKPTIHEDTIYVGTQAGFVYKLNSDLEESSMEKFELDGAVTGTGAVSEDGVFFSTTASSIWMIGYDDSLISFQTEIGGSLYGDSFYFNNTIFIPLPSGGESVMYEFNLGTNRAIEMNAEQ